ncbi:glycosyltransferase family 2 protein [Engelhardtia mirabilis]|uniref:Undecaprenyl-phosphate mannosyltransferase n=1 Tax=Engelhardtia mirabilis TaxID=2528011 RepID=A0A518BIW1_9BACT|nr:Undecaprenyl-phosphate mannosyltransferase [Planctomycetes bacterium Pla133]QDV01235.1 Undecaprenyl-phosphate mannosyltransferase [Planctomycetes bacterium Pla86]
MTSGRRRRVGLVIPALDEEQALPLVLAELPRDLLDRVVVVDNGSTDRTAQVAREGGAEVVSEPRKGYGQACQAGLARLLEVDELATAEDSTDGGSVPGDAFEGVARFTPLGADDVIVFCDADHSDFPADLAVVLAPVLSGRADFAIGSRVLGGADMAALLPQAWFGNRLACGLMRLFFGARYTDLGPMRAIRVDALRHLSMTDRDFGWTVEMQLKAHTAKLTVLEVPVRYRPRTGRSKITGTITGTIGAGVKILGWIFTWRLRLIRPSGRIPRFPSRART